MVFKPYCHSCNSWHTDQEGHLSQSDNYDDYSEECGRWVNGRLSNQCRIAGTEWCDWDCPLKPEKQIER